MIDYKNAFSNIRERIRNPIVFAYITSWLIWNWKITITLIWYDPDQYIGKTIYVVIEENLTWHGNLFPLLFSLGYVFGMPYLKNFVKEFLAEREKDSEGKMLNIYKDGKVPFDKYFDMRESYLAQMNKLEEVIAENRTEQSKINDLENKIVTLNNDLLVKEKEINTLKQDYRKSHDSSVLKGEWEFTIKQVISKSLNSKRIKPINKRIYIENDLLFEIDTEGNKKHVANILLFKNDGNQFLFVKRNNNSVSEDVENNIHIVRFENYIFCSLTLSDSLDILKGTENDNEVIYRRINKETF